jgi:hypothetical protein
MKKNLFYTILTLLIYSNLSSQGNLYIGAQAGFHFQTNPSPVEFLYNNNNGVFSSNSFSLGGGFRGGILMGFLLSDYIGIELGISYQNGNKVNFIKNENGALNNYSLANNSIKFTPAILINPGLEFINPYGKFGFNIASNETILTINNQSNRNIIINEFKLTGGLSFGFYAAAGVSIPLSENINLFTELDFNLQSFSPSIGKLNASSIDGNAVNVSILPDNERYIYFVEQIDTNIPVDPNKPKELIKTNFSINSVGLSLGTRIFF